LKGASIIGFVELHAIRLQNTVSFIDCRGQPIPDCLKGFTFDGVKIEKAGNKPFGVLGRVKEFFERGAMILRLSRFPF
jgi:hypothetical protein